MTELGLPGAQFRRLVGDVGTAGPAGRARPDTINGWVNEAVKDLGAEGRLAALGIEPYTESPQFFAQFIAEDHDRSAKLLKAANFQPE